MLWENHPREDSAHLVRPYPRAAVHLPVPGLAVSASGWWVSGLSCVTPFPCMMHVSFVHVSAVDSEKENLRRIHDEGMKKAPVSALDSGLLGYKSVVCAYTLGER